MSNKPDQRRMSGNMPLPYDVSVRPPTHVFPTHPSRYPVQRQQPFNDHPPPGPSAPFAYYDRYGPPEEPIAPAFREGYANEYNPNFWKPEPDFFPPPPPPPNPPFPVPPGDNWQRPPGWREPEPPVWNGPEGREPPPLPPPPRGPMFPSMPKWNRRGGGPRHPPNRLFEPSDNWKQTHERYRPYTPPNSNPNMIRNRFGNKNGARHSFHGPQSRQFQPPPPQPFQPPPYEDEQHWGPDEDLYGDSGSRDNRSSFPNSSTSPDRPGRSDERSVSPASPRSAKYSSPTFGPGSFAAKRESPEISHLEAFAPRKPPIAISEANRIPLPTTFLPQKPRSHSPLHSTNAGTANAVQVQLPQAQSSVGLPPEPSPKLEPRQPMSIPLSTTLGSKPPAPQVPPAVDQAEKPVSSAPSEVVQQKQPQATPALNGRNNIRRPFNAPSFVPSTLAIDAPLMFPKRNGTSETVKGTEKSDKPAGDQTEDMEVSTPTPLIKDTLDAVEAAVMASLKPPSPSPAPQPTVSLKVSDQAVVDDGDAADESDMDMSPPASPVIKAALLPAVLPSDDASSSDRETSRPSLAVDTSVSSPHVPHAVPRQSSSASPVPTTPENADEMADDESDMEMSSAASETAPSPLPEPLQVLEPAFSVPSIALPPAKLSLPQPPTLDDDSIVPGLTFATPESVPLPPSVAPSPPAEPPAVAPSPPVGPLSVAFPPSVEPAPLPAPVTQSIVQPVVELPTTSIATPVTPTMTVREVSTQTSPLATVTTMEMEKPHVEAGELSPQASEETLREETEGGTEKDVDMVIALENNATPAAAPEKDAVLEKKATTDENAYMEVLPQKEAHPAPLPEKYVPAIEKAAPAASRNDAVVPTDEFGEKDLQHLPLSQALRLVAKLRFRHDPITQDARVEPILFSNRQLAESEAVSSPEPETVVQPILEKEKAKEKETKMDAVQQPQIDGMLGGTKHSLRKRFAQHQVALSEKVTRLRKEYLALHERWMVHCAKLDEIARASALEEAAATAGRTTRRTAAMGDAVRSDLEMEQILASLGNEELTDANHLSQKNAATIPDMVSVTKGRVEYIYDDTNNRVEDPHDFYKLETGIDDWTEQEKQVLIDKYAIHPKQFGIIADYLPNKSPAQCVTYYYLHKNTTIDFRKVVAQYNTIGKRTRRGRNAKAKGNALLTDILKHDDEVSRKRDGTPSTSGRRKRGAAGSATPVPPASTSAEPSESASTRRAPSSRRGTAQNTPDPTPTPDPEPSGPKRPRRRANLSAKAAAALEADGGDEPAEEERPAKRTRKGRKSKAELEAEAAAAGDESQTPSTPVTENKPSEPTETSSRKKGSGSGNWSEDDKALFLKLLAQHGDDFKRIAASMANKTTIQVSAFYRSHSTEMNLSKVVAQAPKRSPTPHEKAHHGSSFATPSSSKAATPAIDAVTRSKSSGRMSPPPNPDGSQPSGESSSAPHAQPKGIPVPTYRPSAPYQGGIGSAFASTSRGNPNPLTSGLGGRPPTLTMSFPSAMAYSNLSPSNFAGQPPTQLARSAPPGVVPGMGGNNNSVMFEFSEFAPQPWQVPALTHPGGAPVVPGGGPGRQGAPATLETTDDLVRYLEHRTRLSAGQSNESDFM